MDRIERSQNPTHRSIPALARVGLLVSPGALGVLGGLAAAALRNGGGDAEAPKMYAYLGCYAVLALTWGGFRLIQGRRHLRLLASGEELRGRVERVERLPFAYRSLLALYALHYAYGDPPCTVRVYEWSTFEPRDDVEAIVVRDRTRPYLAAIPIALRIPLFPGEGGAYKLFHGAWIELMRFAGVCIPVALWTYFCMV